MTKKILGHTMHLSCPYFVLNIVISRVSCQKGPNGHAYAWQIGPFWQDTHDMWVIQCGNFAGYYPAKVLLIGWA